MADEEAGAAAGASADTGAGVSCGVKRKRSEEQQK